jgi:hypothetical protein
MAKTNKIALFFSRPKKSDFVSIGIRIMTWSPYNHVAVYDPISANVYEALPDGISVSAVDKWHAKNIAVRIIWVDYEPNLRSKLLAMTQGIIGVPYDWSAVFGLFIVRLSHYFGLSLPWNPLKNGTKKLFCSEYAYHVLREVNAIAEHNHPELLDPKRLYRLIT